MRKLVLLAAFILAPTLPALACDGRLLEGEAFLNAPICVPEKAQRIVVLDPTFSLGMTLELGAPVVGAPLFGMSDEVLLAKAEEAGVTSTGVITEPSIETMIGLQPDLIIGSAGMAASAHDMLTALAPTVLITSSNWRDFYAAIAEVVGREEQLAPEMAALDARIDALKPTIPDKTVSVLRITSWDFQVNKGGADAWAPFAILSEVGVHRSAFEEGLTELARPDWEQLRQLDGEMLLYIIGGSNNSAENGRHEEVLNNPLWQALPAVAAQRVYQIDPAIWMEFSGLNSAHRILDDVERLIIDEANSRN